MNALMLAQDAANEPAPSVFVMEWYSWVGLICIPVVLIAYKVYKNKTMS
ncbi:MAG: hypothetical protein IPK83_08745 [Planctomycetes bacterium]|nr:hypothetical protein [Planctomycetota bacterium]